MGNAGCACFSNDAIRVVSNKRTHLNMNYFPIVIVLNKTEDGFQYLSAIDLQYCYDNALGPFFLYSTNELYSDASKESEVSLSNIKLISMTNYNQYITSQSLSPILIQECNAFYTSYDSIKQIKSLPFDQLSTHLIHCTSTVFRLPLYLSILNSIPLKNYSSKHINNSKLYSNSKLLEQIELDLPRTYCQIEAFKQDQFKQSFRSLLYEIASRDYSIGYVQGMNFIAGFCLILSGNQLELALILFAKLFSMKSKKTNMRLREMYNKDFPLLIKYVDLFREMVHKYEIDLYNKLIEININDHLWVSKWILTLCLTSFDNEIVLKCWDIIIAKGIDYILIICLTIAVFFKKELLLAKRLDQFMDVVGNEILLKKERQMILLSNLISNVVNNTYVL